MIYCSCGMCGTSLGWTDVELQKKGDFSQLIWDAEKKWVLFIQEHSQDLLPFTGRSHLPDIANAQAQAFTVASWQACKGVSFTLHNCYRQNFFIAFMKLVDRMKWSFLIYHYIIHFATSFSCVMVFKSMFFHPTKTGTGRVYTLGM